MLSKPGNHPGRIVLQSDVKIKGREFPVDNLTECFKIFSGQFEVPELLLVKLYEFVLFHFRDGFHGPDSSALLVLPAYSAGVL